MSGYFLYHSIGMYAGKEAAMAAALAEFTRRWSAQDDGQWNYALSKQAAFLDAWRQLLGAPQGTVAQAESVTAALHMLLRGLPEARLRGGKILIAQDCFPSLHFLLAELSRRLGAELVTVTPAEGEAWVSDDRMIAAWGKDVRLALLTWVTSTSSHRADIKRLTARGRDMGTITGVDVTQGIGIRPYDVTEAGADFTIGSSLKWLCGVSGAGMIQASDALIAESSPELRGWFSQTNPFSWDLNAFEFAPDARRFGNGTPSVLPAIASLPGLEFVLETGVETLAADNAEKSAHLYDWIKRAGLDLVSPDDAGQRGGSLMVELPEAMSAPDLVARLKSKEVYADARGKILRLSPGTVTSRDGMSRLTDLLTRALAQKAEV